MNLFPYDMKKDMGFKSRRVARQQAVLIKIIVILSFDKDVISYTSQGVLESITGKHHNMVIICTN